MVERTVLFIGRRQCYLTFIKLFEESSNNLQFLVAVIVFLFYMCGLIGFDQDPQVFDAT